jgi:hypothetical protein
MKAVFALFLFVATASQAAGTCTCTCVMKGEDGKFELITASGPTREAAGEALKMQLGKKKCELSPDCEGKGCRLDDR